MCMHARITVSQLLDVLLCISFSHKFHRRSKQAQTACSTRYAIAANRWTTLAHNGQSQTIACRSDIIWLVQHHTQKPLSHTLHESESLSHTNTHNVRLCPSESRTKKHTKTRAVRQCTGILHTRTQIPRFHPSSSLHGCSAHGQR